MSFKNLALGLCLSTVTLAQAQSLVVCEPTAKDGKVVQSIWPAPIISKTGQLCFQVRGWPEFSGKNCVVNGGAITWTGLVIVDVEGQSHGRDSTKFRVVRPVINSERIEYVIEWTRGTDWAPMQHVAIDRLSGQAVSYFITLNGGEPYQCHLQKRQL